MQLEMVVDFCVSKSQICQTRHWRTGKIVNIREIFLTTRAILVFAVNPGEFFSFYGVRGFQNKSAKLPENP